MVGTEPRWGDSGDSQPYEAPTRVLGKVALGAARLPDSGGTLAT